MGWYAEKIEIEKSVNLIGKNQENTIIYGDANFNSDGGGTLKFI